MKINLKHRRASFLFATPLLIPVVDVAQINEAAESGERFRNFGLYKPSPNSAKQGPA